MKDIDGNPNHVESIGEQGLFYAVPANFRTYAQIANKENPDVVLLLGDCFHGSCPPNKFMEIWESIHSPKLLTLGNHDLDIYDSKELATFFGYSNQPIVAGSSFNQVYVIRKGNMSCRIIMLDSSFDEANQQSNHWQHCKLHDAALDWLQAQFEENQEDYILLCSHVSPHQFDSNHLYFEKQAKQIATIVQAYTTLHPEVKVMSMAGHSHPEQPEHFSNLGLMFPGIVFPPMIRHRQETPSGGPNGVYSVVELRVGEYQVGMEWVEYRE